MSARTIEKICPTCKVSPRADGSAWCPQCRRERRRKPRLTTVDGRTPDKPCSKCKIKPARIHSAYCPDCSRSYQQRYTASANPRGRGKRPGIRPDACNCGNPKCNGLMCERADAVALEATEAGL